MGTRRQMNHADSGQKLWQWLLMIALIIGAAPVAADVDLPKPSAMAKRATTAKSVVASETVQGLPIYAVAGSYDRDNLDNRLAVANQYFQDYRDDVDFLIVFTGFSYDRGGAAAFATRVKNDVQGIGQPLFDYSAAFGSNGQLQTYVDMADMQSWDFNPLSPAFADLQNTAAHELMHRFGVFVRYQRNGTEALDLLGRDQAHWNFFLDSEASVMYGADWQEQNGVFRAIDVRHRYSPLDLYLAGFRAPSEVPPMTLIRGGVGASAEDIPLLGFQTPGTAEVVTIEQIIAASGPRQPNAQEAKKHFRAGLILLIRAEAGYLQNAPANLHRFARELENRFAAMTEGRGTLSIENRPRAIAGSGAPSPLTGSPACGNCSINVAAGKSWLLSKQRPDGAVVDHPAISVRSSASALQAMRTLGFGNTATSGIETFLGQNARHADDWFATAASHAIAPETANWQAIQTRWQADLSRSEGGLVAGSRGPQDIAQALLAEREGYLTISNAQQEQLFVDLALMQNPDGSFGVTAGGVGHLLTTARVLRSLAQRDHPTAISVRQKAVAWLIAKRQSNGAFGDGDGSLATAAAIDALTAAGAGGAADWSSSITYLGTRQGNAGDWAGSVFTTAEVLQVSALLDRSDLSFDASGIQLTPVAPIQGDSVLASVRVRNAGPTATAVKLQWLDGEPGAGAEPIGTIQELGNIQADQSRVVELVWPNLRPAGPRKISAVLDPASEIQELNENNNVVSRAFTISPLPALPDAALLRTDFDVTPSALSNFPTTVTVRGRVRNLGGVGITNLPLRIVRRRGDALVERGNTTVSVPSEQSAAIELSFALEAGDPLQFTVQVDPENQLAEYRENNNELVFSLATNQQLDLEVQQADLTLLTVPAIQGQSASVRVRVRNLGLLDSPNFDLVPTLTIAGQPVPMSALRLQVPAQQTRERTLLLPTPTLGLATLTVALDPSQESSDFNRSNNSASIDFEVAAPSIPNLLLPEGAIQIEPDPPTQGQPATLRVRVQNLGAATNTPVQVNVETGAATGSRVQLGAATLASGLSAGQIGEVVVVAPALLNGGERYFYVTIDPANAIAESNEQDNTGFISRLVQTLPDAAVSLASLQLTPSSPQVGQTVTARVTVRNLGGQAISGLAWSLYEGSAETGALIPGSQAIATIPPGGSGTSELSWTFGLLPAANQLTLLVDPSNAISELREDNNRVVISLLPANDPGADEPYFSPNGDGIKDQVSARFRQLSATVDRAVVVNTSDLIVREFARSEWGLGDGLALTWNGRTSEGVLAPDGDYRIRLLAGNAQVLAEVPVTLDTNQASILEAADTSLSRIHRLPDSIGRSLPGRYAVQHDQIVVHAPKNLDTVDPDDRLPGLYRFDLQTGLMSPVIDASWLLGQGTNAYIVNFELVGAGDYVLLTVAPNGNVNHLDVWKARVDARNVAVRLLTNLAGDIRYESMNAVQAAAVITTAGGLRVLNIDLATGAQTELNTVDVSGQPIRGFADGVLIGSPNTSLWFVSSQPNVAPRTILNGNARAVFLGLSDVGVLVQERTSADESLRWVDFRTGSSLPISSEANTEKGCIMLAEAMADRDQAFVVNARRREVKLIDTYSGAVRTIRLPALQRLGDYAPTTRIAGDEEILDLAVDQVEATRFNGCQLNDPPGQPISKRGADHLPDIRYNGVFVDYTSQGVARPRLLITMGEQILARNLNGNGLSQNGFHGAVDVFSLDIVTGAYERLAGATAWPLQQALDQAKYRDLAADNGGRRRAALGDLMGAVARTLDLDLQIPALILPDGSMVTGHGSVSVDMLLPDGRVHTSSDPLWNEIERMPTESALILGTAPGHSYVSLANMAANLRVQTSTAGIVISGVAADRNFQNFEIDWASASQPDAWRSVGGVSTTPSLGGEMMVWLPPAAGSYRLRLTVRDRAGNQRQTFANVYSARAASLIDLQFNHLLFSPNGDGIQDSMSFQAQALQPVILNLRVQSANGQVIRSESINVSSVGPISWTWDGRNQQGATVPDGVYRLTVVDQFSRSLTVDTTPPELSLQRVAPDETDVGKQDRAQVAHPYFARGSTVSFSLAADGLDDNDAQWTLSANGTTIQQSQGDSWSFASRYSADANVAYRLTATDAAGNRAEQSLADPGDDIRLLAATVSPVAIPGLTQMPFADRAAAAAIGVAMNYAYDFDEQSGSVVLTTYSPPLAARVPLTLTPSGELALDVWLKASVPVQNIEASYQTTAQGTPQTLAVKRWEQRSNALRIVFAAPAPIIGDTYPAKVLVSADAVLSDGSRLLIERALFQFRQLEFKGFVTSPDELAWTQFGLPRDAFFDADQEHVLAWFEDQFSLPGTNQTIRDNTGNGEVLAVSGHRFLATIQDGCETIEATATDELGRVARVGPINCGQSLKISATPDYQQCGATGPSRLKLSAQVVKLLPGERVTRFRLVTRDAQGQTVEQFQLAEPTTTFECTGSACAMPVQILDLSSFPDGDLELRMSATISGNSERSKSRKLTLDRRPIEINTQALGAPAKVCLQATESDANWQLALRSDVRAMRAGSEPFLAAALLTPVPPETTINVPLPMPGSDQLRGVGFSGWLASSAGGAGQQVRFNRDWTIMQARRVGAGNDQQMLQPMSGPAQLQLATASSIGLLTCQTLNVVVDTNVGATLLSVMPEQRVINPDGAAGFRNATVQFRLEEPAGLQVDVRALSPNSGSSAEWQNLLTGQVYAAGQRSWTWDGRLPQQTNAPDGLYELRLRLVDDCGLSTDLSTQVRIDTVPPQVQIDAPSSGATIAAPVVPIQFTVSDETQRFGIRQQYALFALAGNELPLAASSVDAANQYSRTEVWNRGTHSGNAGIRVRATDAAGNVTVAEQAFQLEPRSSVFFADARLEPGLVSPNGDGRSDQTQALYQLARAADLSVRLLDAQQQQIAVLLNAEPQTQGAQIFRWQGQGLSNAAPDGVYWLELSAQSGTNANDQERVLLPFELDRTAPTLTIVPAASGFLPLSGHVHAEVSDLHFADGNWRIGNSTGALLAGDNALIAGNALSEGEHRIQIEAEDSAGNRSELASAFWVDRLRPEAMISVPANRSIVGGLATEIDVVGTARDQYLQEYRLAIAPAAAQPAWTDFKQASTAVADASLGRLNLQRADGDYLLRLQVTDRANQISEVVHAIAVDRTQPEVTLTAPTEGAHIASRLRVEGRVMDAHLRDYRVQIATPDQAAANLWTDLQIANTAVAQGELAALDLNQPDGEYLLRILAVDQVDLTQTRQVRLHLDSGAPAAPLNLVGSLVGADAQLDWQPVGAADLAGYRLYRNGAQIGNGLITGTRFVDSNVAEGTQRYEVTAVDQAGNESVRSNTVTLTIDRTPPELVIAAPSDQATVSGLVPVTGRAFAETDFGYYEVWLAPEGNPAARVTLMNAPRAVAYGELAIIDTSILQHGQRYELHLRAQDLLGNQAAVQQLLTVDTLAPDTPLALTASADQRDANVSWTASTASDLLGYVLFRDGTPVNAGGSLPADLRALALSGSSYRDRNLADGQHVWWVHAIDQAGNLSPASNQAQLTYSGNPPAVIWLTPNLGATFETALSIEASSPDLDVVEMRYEYRAVGDSNWTSLGAALTQPPYRTVWTPGALPYGQYELRATAKDDSNLETAEPPIRQVEYRDLTAPPGVADLLATGDDDHVHLQWSAVNAADLADYRIQRQSLQDGDYWTDVDRTTATQYDDALADGEYRYRVAAADHFDNIGPWSNPDHAVLYSLQANAPLSPQRNTTVNLRGQTPRAGTLRVQRTHGGNTQTLATQSLASAQAFAVDNVGLLPGEQLFSLQLTDADNNRSRITTRTVVQGALPSVPTNVQVGANDHEVTVSWASNPEPDLLGYRVFHRGQPVQPDALALPAQVSDSLGWNPSDAFDGNEQTAWLEGRYFDAGEISGELYIDLAEPMLVSALDLEWKPGLVPAQYLIEALGDQGFVPIAEVQDQSNSAHVELSDSYRTQRLRLRLLRAATAGAGIALAEVRVWTRPYVTTTSYSQQVLDGRHGYQVSALNMFGFESARSTLVSIDIGDAEAPQAVVLSGQVNASDATLNWTASASADVAQYEVWRDGVRISSLPANTLSYIDAGRANGSYQYWVVALDGFDNRSVESNHVTLAFAATAPGAPTLNVSALARGRALQLDWQAGAGPTPSRYRVQRGNAMAGPFVQIVEQTSTSFVDEPLQNGTVYWYTVIAVDAAGNVSPASAPKSGTPSDQNAPAVPLVAFPVVAGETQDYRVASTIVSGQAEPSDLIAVRVAGQIVPSITAVTESRVLRLQNASANSAQWFTADGSRIIESSTFYDLENGIINGQTLEPTTRQIAGVQEVFGLSRDGRVLARRSNDQAWVLVNPAAASEQQVLTLPLPDVQALAIRDDVKFALARAEQSGQARLFALDLVAARALAISGVDPYEDLRNVKFAAREPAALLGRSDGSLLRIDLQAGTTQTIATQISAQRFAFAETDTATEAIVFVDQGPSSSGHLIRISGAQRLDLGVADVFAVSPLGDVIAVAGNQGQIRFLNARTGAEQSRLPVAAQAIQFMVWTASMRLFAADGFGSSYVIDPAGTFRTVPLNLPAGLVPIRARATDAAGQSSAESMPGYLNVQRGSAQPDLALSAEQILFNPPGGAANQAYGAQVQVRNLGQGSSPSSNLRADLIRPDGSSERLSVPSSVPALPTGASAVVAINLGVLTQGGTYRLSVEVDADQEVSESNERNNSALGRLLIAETAAPSLELVLASTQLAANGELTGSTRVTNLGAPFSGSVSRRLETAAGTSISDLGQQVIRNLSFGDAEQLALSWSAVGNLAQDYAVVAILRDEAGLELARQRTLFKVATQRQLGLSISTDNSMYNAGQIVRIRAPYVFEAGNALIENANLLIRTFDAQGQERSRAERALGTLLPGASGTATANWTSALPAGLHQARAELRSGATVLASARTSFQVQDIAAPLQFSGAIMPNVLPFQAGTPMSISFSMLSNAANATPVSALRLVVRNASLTQTMAQTEISGSVAASTPLTGILDLASNPLPIGAYLAQLDAQIQGEASFRALATLSVQVRDGLPPNIRFQSPVASGWVRAPADLAARVTDVHSGVDLVEMAIDGNPYVAIGQDSSGDYVRAETALTEGSHQVRVRARDRAGNIAESESLPFEVDITPPVIQITGVSDGQQSRAPLTPVVTITDDHLASQGIFLNLSPFTSGTVVSADGYYVLSAFAVDLAGNRTDRALQFRIDNAAPTLLFEQPIAGSEINAAQTDVSIRTESSAVVDLTVGAYVAQQRADELGVAAFASVPLVMGSNTLSARASDELGNISAPASIQVTRIDTTQAPLLGSLVPALAQVPLGQSVDLNWQVSNPATAARNGLAIEIEAHHTGSGTTLGTVAVTRDLAAGASVSDVAAFASSGKPQGTYVASLRAQLNGNWVQLASSSFELVDRDPPTLSVLVPAPSQLFNAPFRVSATAQDVIGAVDQVEVSISAGVWQTMNLVDALSHRYESADVDLPDGQYGLQVRAFDQVGNLAQSNLLAFEVDRTAPQILISQASDGAVYATPVTPLIQVSDLNLSSHTITLNGQPFVSGTTLTADGDYELIVRAEDRAGNVSQQQRRFAIDRTAPVIGFSFPADQAVIAAAQIDVGGLTEPGASVEFRSGGNTATVTADAQGGFLIPSVTLTEGSNLLEARARDAQGNTSDWTQRTVRYVPNAGGNVVASLNVVPISVPLGQAAQVNWTLQNQGAVALSNLPVALRFVRIADQSLLARHDQSVSLPINASTSGSHAFDTQSTLPGAHIVLLEAAITDGSGQVSTQLLATQVLDVRDVLAPTVDLIQPQADSVVSGAIGLEVQAVDLHSAVSAVQASAPGFGPVALQAIGNGRYTGVLNVSQEGMLSLTAQADDSAGNRGESSARPVLVDLLPPNLQINGINEGAWYNQPVTPNISIQDVSLRVQQIRLNGNDFVSGTTISADGNYVLSVHAEDALGRSSDVQRTFQVDRTAPVVQISQPANQAIVFVDQVALLGTSEAFASVRIQVGSFIAQATADGQGIFQLAAVPLQPGANVITAIATDRAGNVSAPVQVQVERRGTPVVEVQGDLQLTQTNWPNGTDLSVPILIRNTGTADLSSMPVSLTVTSANNVVLVSQQYTLSLLAGSSDQRSLNLPTNTWGLGTVTLRLGANLPQRGQSTALDTHVLNLTDQETPSLTVLAPSSGQRIPIGFELQATVTDRLSPIAAVRWWWDNEAPRNMSLQDAQSGRYTATLPVMAFGPHVLHWQAEDNAGNRSPERTTPVQVVGTLPLSISSPANGSDIAATTLNIRGQTAPAADVRITALGLDRIVRADASGIFEFANLNIVAGNNHFVLQASDAFGNQSALLNLDVRGIGPAVPVPVPFSPNLWWLLAVLTLWVGVRNHVRCGSPA